MTVLESPMTKTTNEELERRLVLSPAAELIEKEGWVASAAGRPFKDAI